MNTKESQLWRGVITCTYSGKFIAEKIVRGNSYSEASKELGEWFRNYELGSGDWTLSATRCVTRGPETLLETRHEPQQQRRQPQPWPIATGAPPRSVPWEARYR